MKLVVRRLIKEGKVNEVIKVYEKLVAETRKEDGCISYELCQDEQNERLLAIMEEWESAEAIEKHSASAHFTKLIPTINDLTETRYPIEKYRKLI
ncbi:MAG: putative quinol monooxygenase [Christensenellales bacterium]